MRRVEILAGEDPFQWIHPLVRRSLYDGLSVTRRDALHARAAEVLADAGASPGVVAAHLAAQRPSGSAVVVQGLLAAVDEALSRNAPDVAVDLLERALAEDAGQRVMLLLRLGAIEVSRRSPAAIEVLREAQELADDPRQRAVAALHLGEILTHVGYYQEAVSTISDGLAELDGFDPDLALELEVARAVSFAFDPIAGAVAVEGPSAAAHADRARRMAGSGTVGAARTHLRIPRRTTGPDSSPLRAGAPGRPPAQRARRRGMDPGARDGRADHGRGVRPRARARR